MSTRRPGTQWHNVPVDNYLQSDMQESGTVQGLGGRVSSRSAALGSILRTWKRGGEARGGRGEGKGYYNLHGVVSTLQGSLASVTRGLLLRSNPHPPLPQFLCVSEEGTIGKCVSQFSWHKHAWGNKRKICSLGLTVRRVSALGHLAPLLWGLWWPSTSWWKHDPLRCHVLTNVTFSH